MGRKVVIVGGVAGGASVATRVRRLDESAKVIVFEKGPYPSFSNCCLPNFLSRQIASSESLLLMTVENFKNQYNIDVRVLNEVIKIKAKDKKIIVKNIETGKEYEESYDELILAPGSNAIMPRSIKGIDKKHVFSVKNVPDIVALDNYISENKVKDIVVVGGGFIGLEVMENLKLKGYNLSLVEAENQIMDPLDYDMSQILNREIVGKGVNLIFNDAVKEIHDDRVILGSGKKILSDCVVMAVGIYPETSLAKNSGIELGVTGGIKVNQHYETSIPGIYAVGDVIESKHFITRKPTMLSLAGPAQRQARACADHIYGLPSRNKGVVGSSIIKLFDMNAASTGLNEKQCKESGIDYMYSYIIPKDKVGIMPNSNPLFFKLIFDYPSGKILGAQAVGKGNIDKRIDLVGSIIQMNGTLYDLKEMELAYSPEFGTAKDAVNIAALVGINLLNGTYKQVAVTKIRDLVEKGAFIVDVREKDEYNLGHIKNSINIPLSELRGRMGEIPKDRPVYVQCRSGQRSYNAVLALQGNGYKDVYNVQGSMIGLCNYEYYNDKVSGRKPIVTNYNFN